MYVCGTNIPENKPIAVSLQHVYGIGQSMAKQILKSLNVHQSVLLSELPMSYRLRIRQIMEQQLKLGDALKQQINENITTLKNIGCYRGLRHRRNLPARGQRTRSNAHTRKYFVADGI
ncbi:MAG: 30S ribosomal protein S13 [Candidatus Hodgkinia cicadicola]